MSLPKHVIRKATHEDLDYLKKLAKWVTKNSPETKIVIKGHDHIPYKIKLSGVLLYNCGAGWKGEYITQEEDGKFYWHSFKN